MTVHTYDPANNNFTVAGFIISGFGPDTFIEAERDEDAYTVSAGVAGEVVRSKNNSKVGTVTITLMNDSQSNDILSAIAVSDDVRADGVVPLLCEEFTGTTVFRAGSAWVKKMPKMERGKEAGVTQWVFTCADLSIFLGGLT